MKVLLTGAGGQLGRCFNDLAPKGWEILAVGSNALDITNFDLVKETVSAFNPDVIVNAAAYTAVDKAENDVELAALVNECGPRNLALVAQETGCRLVHVSTDYVFDGLATTPYQETDKTNPLSVYGKTKLDGESAVLNVHPGTIVIRTAWVFSEYGNNFVKTMLRLGKQRDSLGVVSDQFGCPTYAGDIAVAIIGLLQKDIAGGIYHFCGDNQVSWSEFAEVIFATAVKKGLLEKAPVVNAISTKQYPTPAARPKYSVLDCSKIKQHGIALSDWKSKIESVILHTAV
ncbi:dTDP-4-dehydrorhamnose reductase [Serratia sp. IR-2025]|uniref:dTDP-4-dehydrorhamnose reductase n=1 Tax=Serratia marcescens TaxID=615 RepID=UPI0038792646